MIDLVQAALDAFLKAQGECKEASLNKASEEQMKRLDEVSSQAFRLWLAMLRAKHHGDTAAVEAYWASRSG
jgi:Tfp pilus assembly protein PilF